MAEITAATVKELRERTGAGMMECKKALGETAATWKPRSRLRTGARRRREEAGRVAAEGLIGVAVIARSARLSRSTARPTVARTSSSGFSVRNVAQIALRPGTTSTSWPAPSIRATAR